MSEAAPELKRYRCTFKGADGNLVYLHLLAEDKDDAKHKAEQAQMRRLERFPLTFDRLEQAKDSGESGLLAIDPRFAGSALAEAWVDAEIEKRKRDQDRYDKGGMKLIKIEEAIG